MKKPVDPGKYNKNQKRYHALISKMYEPHPEGVVLSPEYAHYVNHDLTTFFIRLARYKFVTRMVKPDDKVLDVGCGSGLGSMFLGQYAGHVTGIDVKKTEIADAGRLNKRRNVEFRLQDLYDLPDNELFDVVTALDVVEHFSAADGRKLIAEMLKHIRPDGLLIIGTPSIYSYPHQGKLSRASHIKCYDRRELVSLIDRYVTRTVAFSMNDEVVHTGHPKMAWYYFVLGFGRKGKSGEK